MSIADVTSLHEQIKTAEDQVRAGIRQLRSEGRWPSGMGVADVVAVATLPNAQLTEQQRAYKQFLGANTTAQERNYLLTRIQGIIENRPIIRRKQMEALAGFLEQAEERTFSQGSFEVYIEQAEIISGQYIGRDRTPDGTVVENVTLWDSPERAVIFRFEVRHNGQVIRTTDDPLIGPVRILVPAGDEPNPDHDPADPQSPAMRTVYQVNPRAALREIVKGLKEVAPLIGGGNG